MKRSGFTLLEILIVVVISAAVLAFALPAYKRTQDRNLYLAASGVLMDLGNAVQSLRSDMALFNVGGTFPVSASALQVSNRWQKDSFSLTSMTDFNNCVLGFCLNRTNAKFGQALFNFKYLEPIPFDSGSTYKGYTFYICPQDTGSTANCCGNNSQVVACMWDSDASSTRAAGTLYKGARFLKQGKLEQISN